MPLIATVELGKQPSGLSINARGDLALVAKWLSATELLVTALPNGGQLLPA